MSRDGVHDAPALNKGVHMQVCNGHPMHCSSRAFLRWRCSATHRQKRARGGVRVHKVLAIRDAGVGYQQTGQNRRAGLRGRYEDPVVREVEAVLKSNGPGMRQEWEECKRFALAEMSSCTPYRTAKILFLCKKARVCDEELLYSILRGGLDDEDYMMGFRGMEVGGSVQNLGMLARLARRGRIWKGRSTEELVKEFTVKLLTAHMKGNGFQGNAFSPRWLSAALHGLGLIFMKRRNQSIDRRIQEVSKALVEEFLRTTRNSDTLPATIASALHGCANIGLKKRDGFLRESDICDLVKSVLNSREVVEGQNLSMMVWAMGKMGLDFDSALDMLAAEISRGRRLVELKAQELANIVYGFGLLNYCNSDALGRLSCEITKEERLRSFSGQEFSTIVYGFGLIKYHNSDALDKMSIEIMREERLSSFNEQNLSNLVYSFGLLRYCNPDALDKMCAVIARKDTLRTFKEQGLANFVYGLGLLNYHNDDLDAISEEIVKEERLRSFREQELSNIVYAFGLLNYRKSNVLDKVGAEITKGNRLRAFKEQGLANIVYGFGLLNHCNTDALDKLSDEIGKIERLRSFTGQAMGNIVYGFGLLKYCKLDDLDRIAAEIVRGERLSSFKEQHLSNIVYGFGLLKYCNAAVTDRICAEIGRQERLELFREQELANITKGLSDLGHVHRRVLDLLLERYLQRVDQDQGPVLDEHVSMMMISCAFLNHRNQKFFDFVRSCDYSEISLTKQAHLVCNVLWAWATLGLLEKRYFLDVCNQVGLLSPSSVNKAEWGQIIQAWLYLEMVKKEDLDLPDDTKAVIKKAMEVYQIKRDMTSSRFETKIAQELTEMGVNCATNAPVARGLIQVDILVTDRDPKVVIECDGPHHYSSNKPDGSFMVLGDTLLRNRILEGQGYKVVCIPFFATEGERKELLKSVVMSPS